MAVFSIIYSKISRTTGRIDAKISVLLHENVVKQKESASENVIIKSS